MRTIAELEHQGIAARIKQARKEKGLTQEQMAQLLDVRQRTYQNYESATAPRIPWDRMNDIERITKKKVEWLLHGDSPDLMGALNGNGNLPHEMAAQLERIEAKLDLLLDHHGVTPPDGPVPAPPEELLQPETGSGQTSPKAASRRRGRAASARSAPKR